MCYAWNQYLYCVRKLCYARNQHLYWALEICYEECVSKKPTHSAAPGAAFVSEATCSRSRLNYVHVKPHTFTKVGVSYLHLKVCGITPARDVLDIPRRPASLNCRMVGDVKQRWRIWSTYLWSRRIAMQVGKLNISFMWNTVSCMSRRTMKATSKFRGKIGLAGNQGRNLLRPWSADPTYAWYGIGGNW